MGQENQMQYIMDDKQLLRLEAQPLRLCFKS